MEEEVEKAISIPVKDIPQLKIILATWYSFLRDYSDNFSKGNYTKYLKTPIIYNLAKDEIEIMFTGSDEVLENFKKHIFREAKETSADI